MKRRPRKIIHRYYNPIDNTELDSAKMSITPAVLDNAIATYSIVDSFSAFSDYCGSWSGGIEYSQKRLESQDDPNAAIPSACNGLYRYEHSKLYQLQNPSAFAPMEERPVLVREIEKNYLQYPEYNVFNTNIQLLEELSAFASAFDTENISATNPSVFKGNINLKIQCKCKEDCECKQKVTPKQIQPTPSKQETAPQTNACNCLEEFEREYQEFIEMLRKQKQQKIADTEQKYLSAWEKSGCNCEK